MEQPRINPRSPRAALEPEHVPLPTRRPKGPRHPLVVIGNAVITFAVLIALATGAGLFVGKQRFDTPGPLASDKIVIIPRGGIRDIADQLEREGVINQPYLFMAGVLVLKARDEGEAGEYQFAKKASLRQVVANLFATRGGRHPDTNAQRA